jgi:hypothetical protein
MKSKKCILLLFTVITTSFAENHNLTALKKVLGRPPETIANDKEVSIAWEKVIDNYKKLKKGMLPVEVVNLVGKPDYVLENTKQPVWAQLKCRVLQYTNITSSRDDKNAIKHIQILFNKHWLLEKITINGSIITFSKPR